MASPDPAKEPDATGRKVAEQHVEAFFRKGRAAYLRESFVLPERTWTALAEKATGKAISHLRGECWYLARESIMERLVSERTAWLARRKEHHS